MVHLFVYGTLLFDEIVFALTGKIFEKKPAVLRGFKRCKIIDQKKAKTSDAFFDYPAIKTGLGQIDGMILFDVDEKSLKIIDFYEDCAHSRITLAVSTDDGEVNASVYVWNRKEDLLTDEDWDAHWFGQNRLEHYVKEKIPAIVNRYKTTTDKDNH